MSNEEGSIPSIVALAHSLLVVVHYLFIVLFSFLFVPS